MKMEQIDQRRLLEAYLKQHYAETEVLVVYQDDIDSMAEYESIMQDLDVYGYRPPKGFMALGYLIIEMPAMLATRLINKHNKGGIRLELYSKGLCAHENR